MRKMRPYHFHQGVAKDLVIAAFFFSLQEVLMILYPMALKSTTNLIKNDAGELPSMSQFLTQAGLVLLFLVTIFFVSFYARYRVSIYGAKTRVNARKIIYEKMTRVPTNILYEYGTGKYLSVMAHDSSWVKYCNEQYLQAIVYFVVTILGSCLLVALLSPLYLLILLGAVVLEVGIVAIYRLVLSHKMPAAVKAFDKSFVATRESIVGARDIRILGKLPERTKEATKQNGRLTREVYNIEQAKHSFECINNFVFGVVTFAVILLGAKQVIPAQVAAQLVVINTVIQYIAIVTKAANDIFALIINPLVRGRIAYQRIAEVMDLPEEDLDSGATSLNTEFGSTLVLYRLSHKFWNGRKTISNLSMEVTPGKMIAVCGEAGGGKTTFVKILLRYLEPTEGVVLINGINIKDLNKRYYRSKLIAYCPTYPEFVPGTIRQNIKLFNPDVTDEAILAAFNEIGATHLAAVPSFLDAPIATRDKTPQHIKDLVNIVRCILKPAEFYIFDRSFAHLPNDIVVNALKKLRAENKTCIFTTYNQQVCEMVDEVYFSQSNHTYLHGTHQDLFQSNQDYANFFLQDLTAPEEQPA